MLVFDGDLGESVEVPREPAVSWHYGPTAMPIDFVDDGGKRVVYADAGARPGLPVDGSRQAAVAGGAPIDWGSESRESKFLIPSLCQDVSASNAVRGGRPKSSDGWR